MCRRHCSGVLVSHVYAAVSYGSSGQFGADGRRGGQPTFEAHMAGAEGQAELRAFTAHVAVAVQRRLPQLQAAGVLL